VLGQSSIETNHRCCEGDACRNSKTKCDGLRPACQRCTDRGEKCHYVAKPDLHPVQQLAEAIVELETCIKDHEEFFRLLATVSEADALQLLARLRSGDEMLSLVEAGRQMRNAGSDSHDISTPTLRRSASVNGIISNTTTETIHASEQLAAIVAGGRLPVLEPAVDLGMNAPNLDARKYVNFERHFLAHRNAFVNTFVALCATT
jgi:hypothetical protein